MIVAGTATSADTAMPQDAPIRYRECLISKVTKYHR